MILFPGSLLGSKENLIPEIEGNLPYRIGKAETEFSKTSLMTLPGI